MLQRATIIGVGLIGGSLGLALRERRLAREVVGVTRTEAAIGKARARGAIDRGTTDPAAGVEGADLVVLAVPPDEIVPAAARVVPHLRADAVLTDVASVKAEIVRSVGALMGPPTRAAFVGGHPMAGNEGQGIEAAVAGLFEGCVYLLTPTAETPRGAVDRVGGLARALGALPLEMTPDEHDGMVALVSHLPYLVAAALMGATRGAVPAAGPAFLGATRVAGSPVELWAQICRLNREPIHHALRVFREELTRLEAAIAGNNGLDALLEAARRARRELEGPTRRPARR